MSPDVLRRAIAAVLATHGIDAPDVAEVLAAVADHHAAEESAAAAAAALREAP